MSANTFDKNIVPQYDDDFNNLCEYKAKMVYLMLTEGKYDRAAAMLEDLKEQYQRMDGETATVYEVVKARVAQLLR